MYDEEEDGGGGGGGFLLSVIIPDIQAQTRIVVKKTESVFSAKQAILSRLTQNLPYEPLNYGLYLRAISGRPGKFLDDSRLLSEYAMTGVTEIEFLYKRRDYNFCKLSDKAITKANNKSNQKKLIDFVTHGSVKKIEKILDSGLDPNYLHEDGNTPLGIACGRNGRAECITPLLSGGAYVDFRGAGGLTPIHRAAIGGNTQAMKNLLSLGSSPNYTDDKGLTPLYHAAIMGDDVSVSDALLKHKAIIGQTDQIGWTELHQIAKHGNVHLVDIMLQYGADIDAQNDAGNTPLHVAAQHGKLDVAIHLMKRGADKEIMNSSNQPPNQVAILCGHRSLAKEILHFANESKELLKPQAQNLPKGRQLSPPYATSTLPSKGRKANRPDPSDLHLGNGKLWPQKVSTLPRSFRSEEELSQDDDIEEIEPVHLSTGSSSSGSSQSSPRHRYSDTRRKNLSSSAIRNTPPFTKTTSPPSRSISSSSVTSPRERLYACAPGKKYTVTRDVIPQQSGDLSLSKGMSVEVLYIGKGNFWEGVVGDNQGWFPQSAITTSPGNSSSPKKPSTKYDSSNSPSQETVIKGGPSLDPNKSSQPQLGEKQNIKDITIHKGPNGFGFAMRGVKSVSVKTFKPNRTVPALQYVGDVDKGGPADCAGLEQGDFIVKVNEEDTTHATHQEVVNIIKKSRGTLHMKVVVPIKKPKTSSNVEESESQREDNQQQQNVSLTTPEQQTTKLEKSSKPFSSQLTLPIASEHQQSGGKSEVTITDKSAAEGDDNEQRKAETDETKESPSSPSAHKGSPNIKSNSKKKKDNSVVNQSPLLHSIRYENSKEPTSEMKNKEEIEKQQFDTQQKEENEDDEESLSGFAKQLRQATLDRHSRISADQPKNKESDKQTESTHPDVNNPKKDTAKEDVKKPRHRSYSNGQDAGPKSKKDKSRTPSPIRNDERSTTLNETTKSNPSLPTKPKEDGRVGSPLTLFHVPKEHSSKDLYEDDSSDEDGWSEVAPSQAKDLSSVSLKGMGASGKSTASQTTAQKKPLDKNNEAISIKTAAVKKATEKEMGKVSKSPQKTLNDSIPSITSSTKQQSPTPRQPTSSESQQNNVAKSPVSSKPPKSKPPPVASKPPRERKDTVVSPEKAKLEKPDHNERPSDIASPVLSLKEKFESLSNTGLSKPKSVTSSIGSPLLPISSKKNIMSEEVSKVEVSTAKSKLPHPPKSEREANKVGEAKEPPTASPDSQETDDLPPPLSITDDEDLTHSDEFSSPPPPVLTEGSESEAEDDGYIPPPPPLYDDMDDAEIFDDNPPIHDHDVPVSLDELMDRGGAFSSEVNKSDGNGSSDLLDNIVGQLKTLVTSKGDSGDSDIDEYDGAPPPLPTSPPPVEDDHDQDNTSVEGSLLKEALLTGENNDDELPPIDEPVDDGLFTSSPPLDDLPPPMDEIPLPSPVDMLPPPSPVDVLPPPSPMNGLPPPSPLDELPPPSPIDGLPPPTPLDGLPPPVFDDDFQTKDEFDFVLPPPDAIPPPLVSPDLDEKEDDIFLPPPLDEAMLVEGQEEPQFEQGGNLPSPFDGHPPPFDILNNSNLEFQDEPVSKDESIHQATENQSVVVSYSSKPLDSWTLDDVCQWMADVGLDAHIDTFRENEIVGEHLRDLSREDLKDLGISKVGHIKTFKQKLEPYLTS